MPSARRIGGLLLVFGYTGVVAGSVAWIVSYWDVGYKEGEVYQAALAIGIGLAGLACWRWTVANRRSHAESAVGPTRWMAAAAFAFAAGFAASTYQTYDNHRQIVQNTHSAFAYPHYRLIIAGGSAYTLGLILAAIGFLILGSAPKKPIATVPSTVEIEPSAVEAVTKTEPAP
jgi:predicted DNA repair protein MutK